MGSLAGGSTTAAELVVKSPLSIAYNNAKEDCCPQLDHYNTASVLHCCPQLNQLQSSALKNAPPSAHCVSPSSMFRPAFDRLRQQCSPSEVACVQQASENTPVVGLAMWSRCIVAKMRVRMLWDCESWRKSKGGLAWTNMLEMKESYCEEAMKKGCLTQKSWYWVRKQRWGLGTASRQACSGVNLKFSCMKRARPSDPGQVSQRGFMSSHSGESKKPLTREQLKLLSKSSMLKAAALPPAEPPATKRSLTAEQPRSLILAMAAKTISCPRNWQPKAEKLPANTSEEQQGRYIFEALWKYLLTFARLSRTPPRVMLLGQFLEDIRSTLSEQRLSQLAWSQHWNPPWKQTMSRSGSPLPQYMAAGVPSLQRALVPLRVSLLRGCWGEAGCRRKSASMSSGRQSNMTERRLQTLLQGYEAQVARLTARLRLAQKLNNRLAEKVKSYVSLTVLEETLSSKECESTCSRTDQRLEPRTLVRRTSLEQDCSECLFLENQRSEVVRQIDEAKSDLKEYDSLMRVKEQLKESLKRLNEELSQQRQQLQQQKRSAAEDDQIEGLVVRLAGEAGARRREAELQQAMGATRLDLVRRRQRPPSVQR